ncbi:MAG: AAA family ATPase [Oscillibacter sp.]|nr:AAA family ATPase [Oscillibacter sp.]
MHILEMQAAYGRLRGDSLRLEPGLNLIYAPNESGKSTWCSFIRTMLYGLPTRQSGPLADKNRFAPWTGEAMQGRMDLETGGQRWTVLRDTRRANAPMQNFACTYTGTAQPVPEVNGQNLGETLLGVPREVFQRSAFIGQSGLAVSQDPELERRIAALLSTGQEDVSYSESYDRLKKQLNRRRHNKTGLIPHLEQEQARLDEALRRQAELTAQLENAREQQRTAQTRVEELEQRRAQWEALEKQETLRQWREAQEDLARRSQQLTALQQLDGDLPDRDTLARMQAQLELLEQAGGTLTQARRTAQQRQAEAREAREAWTAHPLYPNDEKQLRQQAEAMTAPAGPGKALPIAAGVLLCAAAAALALLPAPAKLIAAIGAAAAVGLFLYYMASRRRAAAAAQTVQTRKTALQRQTEEYLRLREDARQAEDAARTAEASAEGLTQQLQGQLVTLLAQVQPFWPEANGADGVRVALTAALRRREALDGAALQVQKARIRCDAMSRHLPQPPLPDPEETLPRPVLSREQIDAALPQVRNQLREARSRVDSLTGQLRTMDSPESLQAQRDQCTRRLEALQAEYDAIALAMEALTQANTVLQTRFSPALGAETARIFSAITGGRYDKVLLDRNLSLSAQPAGDAMPRALSLLSQGAGDQLYLAVRLAICRMVLPRDKAAPLILDDALANFDDQRLAAALDWLAEESRSRQILLFTCHRREGDYLRDRAHVISLN